MEGEEQQEASPTVFDAELYERMKDVWTRGMIATPPPF
jgi:hypothetical protein